MSQRNPFKAVLTAAKDTFIPVPPSEIPHLSDFDHPLNAQVEVYARNSGDEEESRNSHSEELEYTDYNDCFDSKDLTKEDLNHDIKKEIDNLNINEKFIENSSSSDIISKVHHLEHGRTHRKLQRRQIELIAIGGTIGVALFVNIGTSLKNGGCLSLLLAFSIWCFPILEITCCCAEMVCYLPIKGAPFCVFADRFVDEAFGVMASWNFWVLEGALIPFELTLFNTLIHFWTADYSLAIPIVVELVVYFLINLAAVKWYGEVEFWLCIFKVLLSIGLMLFTFITMVGGNPQHHAFGFINWKSTDPMLEYIHVGGLGRFQGWLSCLIQASYMIAGPEYLSMAAGETINPRKVLPGAFKGVFYRLSTFFVGGALCVGILCNARDPLLLDALSNGKPGAGSSPYTIAMHNMGIKVLPTILNILLMTSCFSAGNSYTFCSSRTLYGLAIQRRAPKIFSYCNKQGVPIFAVLVSLAWGALAFLQVSKNSNVVLNWITSLITSSQLINYFIILVTYLHFRRAVIKQGIDRSKFTFKAWGQPYLCAITLTVVFIMIWIDGYYVFLPGSWSTSTFLFTYLMCFVDFGIVVAWKFIKGTKYRSNPMEVDLHTGLEEVILHELMLEKKRTLYQQKSPMARTWERLNEFLFGKN